MGAWNDDGTPGTSSAELGGSERGHCAGVGDDDHITWRLMPEGIDHPLGRNRDIVAHCPLSHLSPEDC